MVVLVRRVKGGLVDVKVNVKGLQPSETQQASNQFNSRYNCVFYWKLQASLRGVRTPATLTLTRARALRVVSSGTQKS